MLTLRRGRRRWLGKEVLKHRLRYGLNRYGAAHAGHDVFEREPYKSLVSHAVEVFKLGVFLERCDLVVKARALVVVDDDEIGVCRNDILDRDGVPSLFELAENILAARRGNISGLDVCLACGKTFSPMKLSSTSTFWALRP